MKFDKIILAGGAGSLGTTLARYYSDKAREIIILSRKPKAAQGNIRTVVWDAKTDGDWVKELDNSDLLINLCGKNVNCRYTEKNKAEILSSRLVPTRLLGDVIGKLQNPPALWLNAASATIYRHAEDRPQDEETGDIGYGFSVDVCKQWEHTFLEQQTPQTRKVALRIGIVLSQNGGAFPALCNLVKFGLGGKQGNGNQYVTWIHEQDVAAVTEWIYDHPELTGAINATSPNALKNTEFMHVICKAYGISFGLPSPKWLLEIGAAIIGTETELVLKSRWVYPKLLLDSGYQFQYPEAAHAVNDLVSIY
ncbi:MULTISPECIES: TIGR01777 family oxidoreductase [unclassified Mucilaginibacter]|uniref:TIGR01777 family oxidoreductase n=1 Tax=unclassified Mucilaginibacter TaxID=2617802 RepID=UPI0009638FE1|nr:MULTISPECIES: TIGR01777 family oxidoreductase [unclassified Mucilaginibacter]OJW12754.1 MAG: TIGR01777 family protein [Mucilaginibacter sp. 44-25]PLW90651.1 MAG: TIGR01777 family protein [Mucilaginibacter sp.]PMP65413.1 MAG: TIGR01777 family protein [Mucilaginibacter sp.]HEK20822.1 TIGR01777 family protein [Bacteroidota bacterium]